MSRWTRTLLAAALLALASIARADTVRLLAPADGATLRGGSFAELRWSAAQLPPKTEEWEAFLSIDGGKYYAFRVTPHLDIELRRFTFAVPNVDTRDARILIRTGDEARETHFEARGSFSIVRDPDAEIALPHLLVSGRGEAAREGDPAVLAWADGARNGSGVTQNASPPRRPRSLRRLTAEAHDEPAEAPAADRIEGPFPTANSQAAPRQHARAAEPLSRSVDLLLVCRRRNI